MIHTHETTSAGHTSASLEELTAEAHEALASYRMCQRATIEESVRAGNLISRIRARLSKAGIPFNSWIPNNLGITVVWARKLALAATAWDLLIRDPINRDRTDEITSVLQLASMARKLEAGVLDPFDAKVRSKNWMTVEDYRARIVYLEGVLDAHGIEY